MIEILRAHRMRMQLEASEIGHPGQGRSVSRHDFLRAATRGKPYADYLHPWRSILGRSLLKEKLAADAIRKPNHGIGTPAGAAQRTFGNQKIVTNEVELGVAWLREEHFLRIGDDHLVGADAYDFPRCGSGHGAGCST
jgi:hypothetical protein